MPQEGRLKGAAAVKPLYAFVVFGSAVVVMALVAIAAMFSITAGHPSWVLISIFVVDSLAVIALAGRALLTWRRLDR